MFLLSVLGASSAPKGTGPQKRRLERAVNPEGGAPSEVSTGDAEIPIGMMLTGEIHDDSSLLQIAHAYDKKTEWSKIMPKLVSNNFDN